MNLSLGFPAIIVSRKSLEAWERACPHTCTVLVHSLLRHIGYIYTVWYNIRSYVTTKAYASVFHVYEHHSANSIFWELIASAFHSLATPELFGQCVFLCPVSAPEQPLSPPSLSPVWTLTLYVSGTELVPQAESVKMEG